MRSKSFLALLIVVLAAVAVRLCYFENNSKNGYNATTYDALGYYMYSPALYIHKDVKKLEWFPEMDSTYHMTGGLFYQATPAKNGNLAFKYFGGVSIMQLPFFTTGHLIAKFTDAPEDGFSWPYQYAIMWGAIFWYLLGLFVLRKVLLRYYSETISAFVLLALGLATNIIQYVGVDGAQSHAYIFPLYCFVLWWTIRWHEAPSRKHALLIGLTIGLATISRPTELIMFFIPLLWGLDGSANLKSKWQLVRANKSSIYFAVIGAFLGMLPQFVYWKYVTGSWIFDVGSKWTFLNPWWRVLVGFEKGWFIYTPITIMMCIGLFLLKGKPYRKAILTFYLLNIWVIISWFDWRYGGTYSTRALVQSMPVLALPMAAFVERVYLGWKKYLFISILAYLSIVNLFQIWQYNETILHYDHMNRKYYNAIYLDANPSPLDYSLLDTDELMEEELPWKMKDFRKEVNVGIEGSPLMLFFSQHKPFYRWLETRIELKSESGIRNGIIHVSAFKKGKLVKERKFRTAVPRAEDERVMKYQHQFLLPAGCDSCSVSLETWSSMRFRYLKSEVRMY